MLSLHDQSGGPWILLHVVSGPWTSIVAALDKGRFNMAVCGRYTGYETFGNVEMKRAKHGTAYTQQTNN